MAWINVSEDKKRKISVVSGMLLVVVCVAYVGVVYATMTYEPDAAIPTATELRAQKEAARAAYYAELDDIVQEGADAILRAALVAIRATPPVVAKCTVKINPTKRTDATVSPRETLEKQFATAQAALEAKGYIVCNVRLYDTSWSSFGQSVGFTHKFDVSWMLPEPTPDAERTVDDYDTQLSYRHLKDALLTEVVEMGIAARGA